MARREWQDAPASDTFNDVPNCPHCNYEIDPTDLRPDCDDEQVIDCPSCNKTLLVQWHYTVTYSTFKPKETP